MRRSPLLIMLLVLFILGRYTLLVKQERLQVEHLLWVEFDAALHGLIRLLHLAESSPQTARAPLFAAYEHGLIVRRLGSVAERLLEWRGVKAEPLAGYLISLTGGVNSLCEEARLHGVADANWIAEIRQRLEVVRGVLNSEAMRNPNRTRLQLEIQGLFDVETTGIYFLHDVSIGPAPLCAPL